MTLFKLLPALSALSLAAWAQAPVNSGGDTDIQHMQQQIADLESKLVEMNEKLTSATPADSTSSDTTQTPAAPHGLQLVTFHGVSDFTFGRPVFDVMPANGIGSSANSFNLGDLDLYTSVNLSEKLSFFAELLVTSDFSMNSASNSTAP